MLYTYRRRHGHFVDRTAYRRIRTHRRDVGHGPVRAQLAHVDTVAHEVVKHVRKEFRQFADILEVETG